MVLIATLVRALPGLEGRTARQVSNAEGESAARLNIFLNKTQKVGFNLHYKAYDNFKMTQLQEVIL